MGRPPKVGKVGMADFKSSLKRGPPCGVRYWKPSAFYDIERTNAEHLRSRNPFAAPDPPPAPASAKKKDRTRGLKQKKKVAPKTPAANSGKKDPTDAGKGAKVIEVRQSIKAAEQASGAEEAMGRKASSARVKRTDLILSLTGEQGLDKVERDIAKMRTGDEMEEDEDEDNAPAFPRDTRRKTAADEEEVKQAMAASLEEKIPDVVPTHLDDSTYYMDVDKIMELFEDKSDVEPTNVEPTKPSDNFWPPYGTDATPPTQPTCFLGLARVPADTAFAFKTELGQHLQVFYQNTQFSSEPAQNTDEDLEDVGVEFISKDIEVVKQVKKAIDGTEVQGKKLQVVFAHEW